MRIAKIILMTFVFSMLAWHVIFSWLFYTWYAASGWFMALYLASVAVSLEIKLKKFKGESK